MIAEAFLGFLETFPASIQRIVVFGGLLVVIVWQGTHIADKMEYERDQQSKQIQWIHDGDHKRDQRFEKLENALVTLSENQTKMLQLQADTTMTLNRVQDRLDNGDRHR